MDTAYKLRIGQGDALMFMRAAVIMHTLCLQSQEPFDGSFPLNCLTGPVNEEMRSFFNVVLRGRSALCGRDMVAGDTNLDTRRKIAFNISQLLIYNTIITIITIITIVTDRNIGEIISELVKIEWDEILNSDDINFSYETFVNKLTDIYRKKCPIVTSKVTNKRHYKPWMTNGLKNACKRKTCCTNIF